MRAGEAAGILLVATPSRIQVRATGSYFKYYGSRDASSTTASTALSSACISSAALAIEAFIVALRSVSVDGEGAGSMLIEPRRLTWTRRRVGVGSGLHEVNVGAASCCSFSSHVIAASSLKSSSFSVINLVVESFETAARTS